MHTTDKLVGGESSASRPGRFTQQKADPIPTQQGSYMATNASLDALEKNKNILHPPGIKTTITNIVSISTVPSRNDQYRVRQMQFRKCRTLPNYFTVAYHTVSCTAAII
jgi:hypothetical protein